MMVKKDYSFKGNSIGFKVRGIGGTVFLLEPKKISKGKVAFPYVSYSRHYQKYCEDLVYCKLELVEEISKNIPKAYKEQFDSKIKELKESFIEALFEEVEGVRFIEKEGNEVLVSDFLLIEDRLRVEQYSSFEKSELQKVIENCEEEVEGEVIDFLSALKMWVTDYEEGEEVFNEMFLLDLNENIEKIHPDKKLAQFIMEGNANLHKVICKY